MIYRFTNIFRSRKIESDVKTAQSNKLSIKIRLDGGQLVSLDKVSHSSDLYAFAKERFYKNAKPTLTMSKDYIFSRCHFTFFYKGKPLSRSEILLVDYNIHDGDILDFVVHLGQGGSELPSFTHTVSYNVLLEEYMLKSKDLTYHKFQLQGSEGGLDEVLMKFVRQFVHQYVVSRKYQADVQWIASQIDNVFLVAYWFKKCESLSDFEALIQMAYKLFVGRSMYSDLFTYFMRRFASNLQAGDDIGDLLALLRRGLTGVQEADNTPLFKKIVSMYSYLLVHGFLERFGFEINDLDYTRLEQKALYATYSSKKDMWLCILDTTLFICEKLHEYKNCGEISVFYHSSSEYSKWIQEANRILALAPFVSNLEAHGTTYFAFVSDLSDSIEKGVAYTKYTVETSGTESSLMKKKLYSLQLLKNTEITRRASQKERQSPFGVLVYGSSSVAKSSFAKMLYYYYGSLHGLDKDEHYRYVRNPADEYWSNFDSSKWCIQMDDIAFLHPNKTSEPDPTLMEMLNVVNNVPYVPAQAALEDKGKTPVMARMVIATTNAKDLNAAEYFWCPIAVRRRLPYVVTVKPKPEYLHANGKFIDPSRLTPIDGDFPDYWIITLHKVVPVEEDDRRDHAKLEDVRVFDNTKEFLKDFGRASLEHLRTQEKSMACDREMRDIAVCPLCLTNTKFCECQLQARFIGNLTCTITGFLYALMQYMFTSIVCFQWFVGIQMYLAKFRLCRRVFIDYLLPYHPQNTQLALLGQVNGNINVNRRWKVVLVFLAALSAALALYVKFRSSSKDEEQTEQKEEKTTEKPENFKPQGNSFGTVEGQLQKEEKQNVWYNDTIELTKFDLPVPSQSLVDLDDDTLRTMFERNCVFVRVKGFGGKEYTIESSALFLRGHYCLLNNHVLRMGCDHYEIEVIQSSSVKGLNANLKVVVGQTSVFRDASRDICVVEVTSLPPFKDITKFWSESQVYRTSVLSLRRDRTGHVQKRHVFNVNLVENFPVEELSVVMPVYIGHANEQPAKGDCGSIAIAKTPRGCVIIGIHMLGYQNQCGYTAITRDSIEALISQSRIRYNVVEVHGGGEPLLDLEDKKNILTQPHHRSLMRYLEEGTANVYGSFAGFRPKPKSHVCSTPLSEKFLNYYGTEVRHGKPAMDGWEPWRKNVEQMVQPYVNYDKDVLQHCVQSFSNDILSELPRGWEKELVTLSRRASVNGLPGVVFIDKINRNTSMGFPWCSSKKGFLSHSPCEKYPEGVDFGPEVWERVDHIEKCYKEGRRAYPVFTGHLKDEATSLAKCKAKKTRVFTGAPVDWSIVVRSRLLSFVRLLQKNKFVFEAGPGTVCQSAEWGQIRKYLTHFGEDRCVAGDYEKFDKKMISDFILAAFQVICNVYRAAGFSEEEIREIMCIGEDTAFPVVNMNGDLLEFFGTNPSGHPLTVIVNSLVNSLYMRYAYTVLNPAHKCTDFKKYVHLMTYGDDNIMGISQDRDWFNHTTIQKSLADIGVVYTMADKTSESVPYIHIDECSFLKREWRFDVDVGDWLCPLDEESIVKSLTMWVPSKTIDKYAQMVAVISSANSEYFFYGKKVFEKHHKFFRQILDEEPYKFYETSGTLPSWEQLKERFKEASSSS
jgi:hypothetical protein